MWDALDPRVMIAEELVERRQAGFDVSAVEQIVRAALDDGSPAADRARVSLDLEATELRSGWSYEEPSSPDGIRRTLPPAPLSCHGRTLTDDELRDRLLGAWLGRCAGCNLGKPVEGWSRARIRRYLELADAYPITDYVPVLDPMPTTCSSIVLDRDDTRATFESMARDDDIDYTILGLHVIETWGFGFGPEEVAAEWLDHLPFTQVYTAEQARLPATSSTGCTPRTTASHRNPYREWIGAQIRADLCGVRLPGDPRPGIELAWRPTPVLSHTQNGDLRRDVGGGSDRERRSSPTMCASALEISLGFVPPRSRLAEALRPRDRSPCDGASSGSEPET